MPTSIDLLCGCGYTGPAFVDEVGQDFRAECPCCRQSYLVETEPMVRGGDMTVLVASGCLLLGFMAGLLYACIFLAPRRA